MDFIKNLISGIQGFLGGILGFITGLLPAKKKSNGYFLELDEAKDAAKEVASNAKKVAETVTSTVASNAKKVAETITSEAPTLSKPDSLNGTKTAATKAKAKEKSAKNPKPADVQLVQTAEGLRVEPGKKEKAAAAKVLKEQPTETTFAPKYLSPSITSSNGRRRPGANMSAYLDMARQIKTPK
ncbi:YtxH domain-containing protein [Nostoc sp. NMS4]|uniref:YtxH domain-containing protein n=1 Tax=Nostoc sp. NMS4 TaxID=2815390 RepID=UPI0025FE59D9|nr:YtxH domain-containing protein [Nostoc sp. NMS4]MBN3923088.1 YtxH domain-containing protein [Nostoc sp. NMS4]